MDLEKLEQTLIAASRADKPSEEVPYAFEKRVMARLRAGFAEDPWALWARSLWRAAAPCVAIMLLLVAWSAFDLTAAPQDTNLLQQFDNTVLAAAAQESITETPQ